MLKSAISRKLLFLAIAVGIISFSTFGLHHTVHAYNDITETQTIIGASDTEDVIVPGGSFCSPLGCAACSGCVNSQYRQNIEGLPSSTIQLNENF
jgi:hypothetical protein